MKAIVLAAGYATRLKPLTDDRAKSLLPVGDRPMLDWIADKLDDQQAFGRVVRDMLVSMEMAEELGDDQDADQSEDEDEQPDGEDKSEEGGEDEIKACVVGGSLDAEALWAWCDERLPSFAVPRYLQRLDALPKTPTSKVIKHELRSNAAGELFDRGPRGRVRA